MFFTIFRSNHPWNVTFFRREIQIAIANIFPAINLKTIKDDYSRKFAEIFEKVQKWSFLFRHFLVCYGKHQKNVRKTLAIELLVKTFQTRPP
jgi:hypothetical protein